MDGNERRLSKTKHKHHLIPRFAGGDNDPSNLTPPISIQLHAAFHFDRWVHVGDARDLASALLLLGQISTETTRLIALRAVKSSDAHRRLVSQITKSGYAKLTKEERRLRAAPMLAATKRGGKLSEATKSILSGIVTKSWRDPAVRQRRVDGIGRHSRQRWSSISAADRRKLMEPAHAAVRGVPKHPKPISEETRMRMCESQLARRRRERGE